MNLGDIFASTSYKWIWIEKIDFNIRYMMELKIFIADTLSRYCMYTYQMVKLYRVKIMMIAFWFDTVGSNLKILLDLYHFYAFMSLHFIQLIIVI